ncbi:MAG: glycosyltransferase family 2 protein [Geminicoccaceae bacterium]
MPATPAISIISPFRDAAEFLPGLLANIDAQAVDAYELLLVDDGSIDASCNIVDDAKRQNDRIRLLASGGQGVATARNLAIQESRAPLIAFLDVDDRWHPESLPSQLSYMETYSETTFSFANYAHVDETGPFAVSAFEFWPLFKGLMANACEFQPLEMALSTIFIENAVGTSTVVARREAVLKAGSFDLRLPSATDWDLWLRLAQSGAVACSPEIRMDYLMRPGSISSNRENRLAAVKQIIERYGMIVEQERPGSIRRAEGHLEHALGDFANGEARYWSAAVHHAKAALATLNPRSAHAAAHDLFAAFAS